MTPRSKANPPVKARVRKGPTASSARVGASTTSTDAMESFLGRGWAFPIATGGNGEAALVADEDDVRQAIEIILATAPGERVMRPDFGAGLKAMVFEPLSATTIELVRDRVGSALARWERRITVRNVDVQLGPDSGLTNLNVLSNSAAPATTPSGPSALLLIEIDYVINASNTAGNLVFPFYLLEGGNS